MQRTAGLRVHAHVDAGPPMGGRVRLLAKDGALAGAWPQAQGREGRRVPRVYFQFILFQSSSDLRYSNG